MAVLPKKKRGPKQTRTPVSTKAKRLGLAVSRLREAKGLTAVTLAKMAQISQPMLSKIENGLVNPDNPKAQGTIRKIAEHLGESLGQSWLDNLRTLPIEGRIAAGRPIEAIDEGTISVDPQFIRTAGEMTTLRVQGDSMVTEHILNGDILVCRKTADPPKGSIVVVELKGERGSAVKRFERKGDMIYLYAEPGTKDKDKQPFHTWEVGKIYEITGLIRRIP